MNHFILLSASDSCGTHTTYTACNDDMMCDAGACSSKGKIYYHVCKLININNNNNNLLYFQK